MKLLSFFKRSAPVSRELVSQSGNKSLFPEKEKTLYRDGTWNDPGRFLQLLMVPTFWEGRSATRLEQARQHDINSTDHLHQLQISAQLDYIAHMARGNKNHGVL